MLAVTDGVGWLHFRGGKDHGVAGEGVVGLPSADDMARTQAAGGKPKVKRPKREKRHPLMEGREGSSFGSFFPLVSSVRPPKLRSAAQPPPGAVGRVGVVVPPPPLLVNDAARGTTTNAHGDPPAPLGPTLAHACFHCGR